MSAAERIEAHATAWKAWEAAWDRARNSDVKAGRPPSRERCRAAAHRARVKVLRAVGIQP